MLLKTREGVPFLNLNGIETQSAAVVSLLAELPSLVAAGVDVVRVNPQGQRRLEVLGLFRAALDGRIDGAEAARRVDGAPARPAVQRLLARRARRGAGRRGRMNDGAVAEAPRVHVPAAGGGGRRAAADVAGGVGADARARLRRRADRRARRARAARRPALRAAGERPRASTVHFECTPGGLPAGSGAVRAGSLDRGDGARLHRAGPARGGSRTRCSSPAGSRSKATPSSASPSRTCSTRSTGTRSPKPCGRRCRPASARRCPGADGASGRPVRGGPSGLALWRKSA